MHHYEIYENYEWKWDERALCLEHKDPLMETAKVGDLGTLKQLARERTQEPLKKKQLKGGEFRRSGRKRSGKRRRRKRKNDKKKKVKYRRRSWWKKCNERIASFLTAKRKEEEEKETKGRKSDKRHRTRQVLGKSGRLLFLLTQNWLYVNAAAEGLQKRTEIMEKWHQQRFQAKEGRWVEEIPQRWKQPKEKTGLK